MNISIAIKYFDLGMLGDGWLAGDESGSFETEKGKPIEKQGRKAEGLR